MTHSLWLRLSVSAQKALIWVAQTQDDSITITSPLPIGVQLPGLQTGVLTKSSHQHVVNYSRLIWQLHKQRPWERCSLLLKKHMQIAKTQANQENRQNVLKEMLQKDRKHSQIQKHCRQSRWQWKCFQGHWKLMDMDWQGKAGTCFVVAMVIHEAKSAMRWRWKKKIEKDFCILLLLLFVLTSFLLFDLFFKNALSKSLLCVGEVVFLISLYIVYLHVFTLWYY